MTDNQYYEMELKSNKPEKNLTLVGFLLFFLVVTLLIVLFANAEKALPEPKTIMVGASDTVKEEAIRKYKEKVNLPKKKNIYDYWIENPSMLRSNYEHNLAVNPAGETYITDSNIVGVKNLQ